MKGYLTSEGYIGFLPQIDWVLFATEHEYEEFFKEYVKNM
jgi:hypothetical protein